MAEVIYEKIVIARKNHNCNGCEFYLSNYNGVDFSFKDRRVLVGIRKDQYKILKGQKYIRRTCVGYGSIWTYKVRIDVDDLLTENELYDEY